MADELTSSQRNTLMTLFKDILDTTILDTKYRWVANRYYMMLQQMPLTYSDGMGGYINDIKRAENLISEAELTTTQVSNWGTQAPNVSSRTKYNDYNPKW